MKESPFSSSQNLLFGVRPGSRWREIGKKGRFRWSLPSQSIPQASLPANSSRR